MATATQTPKRHLDLWIGVLLGVGFAATMSAFRLLSSQGLNEASFAEIEGRLFFALTAAALVVTHIYRQAFVDWNKTFVALGIGISSLLSILIVRFGQQGILDWLVADHKHLVPVVHDIAMVPFAALLFFLLAYAEALFSHKQREQKLIPLPTIALHMVAVLLLIYTGRMIFPPDHIFLTLYLAIVLFDMTSRVPVLAKEDRWKPLLKTKSE